MRQIWEIKQAMAVGSEWSVYDHANDTTSLWRIARIQTNGFWLQGPLEEARAKWTMHLEPWPTLRQLTFLSNNKGFTVKVSGKKTTYTKQEVEI